MAKVSRFGWRSCGSLALWLLPFLKRGPTLILFCPLLSASAILPLSAFFLLVVQSAYFLGRLFLGHIGPSADGSEQVWVGLPECLGGESATDRLRRDALRARVQEAIDAGDELAHLELPKRCTDRWCCKWTDALAGPTHTCLSWIQQRPSSPMWTVCSVDRRVRPLPSRARAMRRWQAGSRASGCS